VGSPHRPSYLAPSATGQRREGGDRQAQERPQRCPPEGASVQVLPQPLLPPKTCLLAKPSPLWCSRGAPVGQTPAPYPFLLTRRSVPASRTCPCTARRPCGAPGSASTMRMRSRSVSMRATCTKATHTNPVDNRCPSNVTPLSMQATGSFTGHWSLPAGVTSRAQQVLRPDVSDGYHASPGRSTRHPERCHFWVPLETRAMGCGGRTWTLPWGSRSSSSCAWMSLDGSVTGGRAGADAPAAASTLHPPRRTVALGQDLVQLRQSACWTCRNKTDK